MKTALRDELLDRVRIGTGQLAELSGYSRRRIADLIAEGKLEAENVAPPGKRPRWVVTLQAAESFIEEHAPPSEGGTSSDRSRTLTEQTVGED